MALLAVTTSGAAFTPVAAAVGGDEFPNDGMTVLWFQNTSGAPITVTFEKVKAAIDPDPQVIDRPLVVAAGAMVISKACEPEWFNTSLGRAQVTYSGVTGLTVAALRIPNARPVP